MRGAPGDNGRIERVIAAAFVVTTLSALGLAAVYWEGGHPQAEGALLGLALGSLGIGLVLWAHRLLPQEPRVEERKPMGSTEEEREAVEHDFEGRGRAVGRRTMLVRTLAAAAGALGLAALFPIRSLGPRPGRSLVETPWRRGLLLITEEGRPVRAEDVPIDSFLTVFPEDHPGSPDGQAVLVRVREGLLRPDPDRDDWSPDGFIAFSKICTHAGCPVGLYQSATHQLLCPCHQSAFDVLARAEPVFGPAARALPQLPLLIDDDGFLRARGEFPEPVGPAWWSRK